ncbi:TonB family C-terminal domain-containing protein [Methylomagnum ishizawai]|uniref:TonB family C-terminal domain-containing protein n=1 Tax=Methylomagnum ishizawai TaxID=1760988 RepID=A0A1Y6D416_9GAMM|nr:energy transducer TonB [Methylomagnum ishizawai]SMF95134.1 TonB family C-terminal domain-containing protein [Methylomagnum ishizawai]
MDKKKTWLQRLPLLIGVGLSVLIAVGVFLLKDLFQKGPQTKRVVQQISVVQPPPPPPPEQKPPEPEVKEEKIEEPEPEPEKEPEPAPEADAAPPGEQLGVDGEGSAGSDAFGLAARKGGRSLLGGTPGSLIHWYGGQVSHQLETELHALLEDTHARKSSYAVMLDIWIGPDGRLSRAELTRGSGKPEVDQAIRDALPKLKLALQKPPPENMPQPVKIRLTSRI